MIASDPEKILDAPNLKDDYYLNLIEWGENGIISVSLGSNLYLLLQNGENSQGHIFLFSKAKVF